MLIWVSAWIFCVTHQFQVKWTKHDVRQAVRQPARYDVADLTRICVTHDTILTNSCIHASGQAESLLKNWIEYFCIFQGNHICSYQKKISAHDTLESQFILRKLCLLTGPCHPTIHCGSEWPLQDTFVPAGTRSHSQLETYRWSHSAVDRSTDGTWSCGEAAAQGWCQCWRYSPRKFHVGFKVFMVARVSGLWHCVAG